MILSTINTAIIEKKLISFEYEGQLRIVEPFLTGKHHTTGKVSLRAWFVKGYSKTGKFNTWKLYTIDKVDNVKILNEYFTGIRPGYNSNDSAMRTIYKAI